jgi:hypothetical protein
MSEPDITELLQQLDAPFQRRDDTWLVEVGGGWATFAWVPRDSTLVGFLVYEEAPGPSAQLVRANAETGLAWYQHDGDSLLTRVSLPADDVDAAGLTLAVATLGREAGGPPEPVLEDAPEPRLEAVLQSLGDDPGEVVVSQRGDVVDLRVELREAADPDETMAHWMLQMSAVRGARLGIDGAGTLCAIAAVPGRPGTAGGFAWALGEVRELARLYRESGA